MVNDKVDDKWSKDAGTEYKKNFRPFSQYEYSDGRFTKRGAPSTDNKNDNSNLVNGRNNESWYREVVELRKKAGEYKVGIGQPAVFEIINAFFSIEDGVAN